MIKKLLIISLLFISLSYGMDELNESYLSERLPYPESEYPAEYIAERNRLSSNVFAYEKPIKSFQCDHLGCTYSTPWVYALQRHKRTQHSGVKPFKCTQCNYTTGDQSHLKNHKKTHNREKHFKCKYGCGYSTAQSTNLKTHTKRAHIKCAHCNKTLVKYYLNTHLKREHNRISFKCNHPGCNKYITYKNALKHKKMHDEQVTSLLVSLRASKR